MLTTLSALETTTLHTVIATTPIDDGLWRVDGVSLLLLVLVVGIGAAVLPFAHRSLRGDRHGTAITIGIGAMLVATAVLALAGPLWMLGLAWSASTAATLVTLGLGGGVRAVLPGAVWLIAADVALWAAVLLMALGSGPDLPALLLVVAAVLRCALPPAQGWLVGSLYAPTPVSAALHGGIVNGGGILVITQFATIGQSALAIVTLATLAAAGLLVGVIASLVKTDIKGRLVMSTVAQMGFMLLCAALGLVAAALLHLVAHGLYKSSLFLSSSDGIDRRAYARRVPQPIALTPSARALRSIAGAALPVLALAAVALAVYPGGRGLPELILLIVVASAFAAAGARAATLAPSPALAATATALLSGGATLYALAASLLSSIVPAAPAPAAGLAAALIAVAALVLLIALGVVRRWFATSRVALALLAFGLVVGEPRSPARPGGRADDVRPDSTRILDRPLVTGASS